MPIHDQGYRRYAGLRGVRSRGWWVIARAAVRAQLGQRRVVLLLLLAWAPFLVRGVQLYASANFTQAAFLAPSPQMFRDFLDWQGIFVFFVTILVGAGLIAEDRRTNALPIYLSKPLTRLEYVTGKLAVLVVFLAFVTWVPALLLLLLQVLFAGSTGFLREHLFLVPALTIVSLVQVFVSGFAILALSALSRSRRFVSMLYAGVILFTSAMHDALQRMTGSRAWAWISPGDTIDIVADAAFRVGGEPAMPLPAAVAVIGAIVVASALVLERRVRGVEVVT